MLTKLLLIFALVLSIKSEFDSLCKDYIPIKKDSESENKIKPNSIAKNGFALSKDFCKTRTTNEDKKGDKCCYIEVIVPQNDTNIRARGCVTVPRIGFLDIKKFKEDLSTGTKYLEANYKEEKLDVFKGAEIKKIVCSKSSYLKVGLLFLSVFLF